MTARTVGAWNARMAVAPIAPAERLIGPGGLVVISPHPDDETLGASALLVAAGRLKRRIALVALTDGDASHPGSRLWPPKRMATLRAAEQDAAMEVLGCASAEVLRLGLPDGAAGRDARFPEAADRVAALCERLGATALAAPHPDDPHPDHHAAAGLALAVRERLPALRILFYEVWSRRLGPETLFRHEGLTPFRIRTDPGSKRSAIDCHSTQLGRVVTDDPAGFVLPHWFLEAQDAPFERLSWLDMTGRVPPPEHFSRLYASDGDPWHVRTSIDEAEKRKATVAMLTGRRYQRAMDASCSEGLLTRALLEAGVAESVVGFDREPAIVDRADREPLSNARFVVGSMPEHMPQGRFDLIVLSEVLYFLNEAGLASLAAAMSDRMMPGAGILVVSCRGPTPTPLSGLDATDLFVACLGETMRSVKVLDTADYRIEHLEWRPAPDEAPGDGA